jgi:hypothetical protein
MRETGAGKSLLAQAIMGRWPPASRLPTGPRSTGGGSMGRGPRSPTSRAHTPSRGRRSGDCSTGWASIPRLPGAGRPPSGGELQRIAVVPVTHDADIAERWTHRQILLATRRSERRAV